MTLLIDRRNEEQDRELSAARQTARLSSDKPSAYLPPDSMQRGLQRSNNATAATTGFDSNEMSDSVFERRQDQHQPMSRSVPDYPNPQEARLQEQRQRLNITDDVTHKMSTAQGQQQPRATIPPQLEQDIKVYITKAMENLQLGRIGDSQNDDLRLSEPMHRSSGKEEYRQTQSENGGKKGTTSQYQSQGHHNSQNFDRRQWKSEFQDPDGHDPQSSSSSYSGPTQTAQVQVKGTEQTRGFST